MIQSQNRIRIAVPVPVADAFEYLWTGPGAPPAPGTRVRVPFGNKERVGIAVSASSPSDLTDDALKAVSDVLDPEPVIGDELMRSLCWAAGYYHHPLGEVLMSALPTLLRQGRASLPEPEPAWALTEAGRAQDPESLIKRAARQADALSLLRRLPLAGTTALRQGGATTDAIRRLQSKGWIRRCDNEAHETETPAQATPVETPPELTDDQRDAVRSIRDSDGFATVLLYGVTGSGKTEVFLRLIDDAFDRGRQCLLLVPEIGLTPQLVRRLERRFGGGLAVLHSGMPATERLDAWRRTRDGTARLIVGTRSAVFAPLQRAAVIVVDEEHDPSFKQQSGFRYSARDLAIMRAKHLGIPVVLASATPSLESYRNAVEGRYRLLTLPRRIGSGGNPALRVIDLNQHAQREGLSTPLLSAMDRHLERGNQVLLFINRRGFAPALFCPRCETAVECDRCDARMTVHATAGQLRCHHCGRQRPLQWACPDCGSERIGVGAGTQRVTSQIESLYPDYSIARLDRDAAPGRDKLGHVLDEIESGRARIIVGTQLLTKGHDFPSVTLVGVLNADQGLFGTDFRSEERLAQTIVQVAGRAGRRDRRGEVIIQTHYPKHPLLVQLLTKDYSAFAEHALSERRHTGWPPYSYLAAWRAEASQQSPVYGFLQRLRRHCAVDARGLRVLGPTPDWMERRAGKYRAHLLIQSNRRSLLHDVLSSALGALRSWPETRRVRWSVDVDPSEL